MNIFAFYLFQYYNKQLSLGFVQLFSISDKLLSLEIVKETTAQM